MRLTVRMASPARLRVATLNVLGAANPDWERRRQLLSEMLQRLDADVVALQEVPVETTDVVDDLLGTGYHVACFPRAAENGVSGALATRWAHRVVEEVDQRTAASCGVNGWATLLVEVDAPIGATLVAHHKPSWQFGYEFQREQQALAATRAIERHVATVAHVLVLGDFDATPDAASVQFWRGRRSLDGISVCYQDAWETARPTEPGFTFSVENPLVRAGESATSLSRRIDYILIRCGMHGPTLQVHSCDRFGDAAVDGMWASDHFGVVADLSLPDHEPGSWGDITR